MHKILIATFIMFFAGQWAVAQTKITWRTLEDVTFTDKYSEEEEAYYFYPEFGASIKALEGKDVLLKGYMLSVNQKDDIFILSKNPYSSCFFCGNGGPESIAELEFSGRHRRFKIDQIVTIKGVLTLNQEDIYHCNYILTEAEEYEPE